MTRAKLDPTDLSDAERFILDNTKPIAPPLVPEIVLRLAEESLPIWQKTEDELGELNVPPQRPAPPTSSLPTSTASRWRHALSMPQPTP